MEPLESKAPHVLIFPLPAQGHVNSMLNLAQLLSLAGLNITFLNTDHNHNRLVLHTNILHRFACFPGFQFKTIPDGLPDDHPRAGERFREIFDSIKLVTKPLFREMLCSGQLNSATGQSVTCIIADGILSFPIDVGNELGIPVIHFRTASACYFWACFCIQDMIEAGELPIRVKFVANVCFVSPQRNIESNFLLMRSMVTTLENEDMDRLIRSVPGMETFLRIRDLPSACQVSNLADPSLQRVANKTVQSPRAHALILNTFEDLEGPIVSHIRTKCPKIYTIGPLHAILKSKLESKTTLLQSQSPNSLFEVDRSCMVWLDAQPLKSVIYVSFGSITVMTKDKLMEFWYGLVNSKKRFLWAIRPDLVIQKDEKMVNHLMEEAREIFMKSIAEKARLANESVSEETMEQGSQVPHVIIFPLPALGPVNSTLKLAELLSLAGLNITFLNTDFNHDRLVLHSNILDRFASFPGFQFKTISDGLPADHPRAGDRFMELFDSFKLVTKPLFREMLCSGQLDSITGESVTCIIADGILSFPIDVGHELGIPVISIRTISACSFWAFFSIQDIIEAGELPSRGHEDMDRLITSVPGMETFLRLRDLPSICRTNNLEDPNLQHNAYANRQSVQAHGLILNTFEDLEGPILSHIRSQCPKVYTLGPLHTFLKFRLESENALLQSPAPNSIYKVDKSCIEWLNAQPLKSVIYISFGSITVLTRDELKEFWYGLVNSKKRFLWVIRPDLVAQKDDEVIFVPPFSIN
ncbi:7-deoxyloganetic acid glucosyltransferase [Quercus suber]|uniref:7-deoxyloganetic acid glucosyltransferase n=1 Tax=Quercus suber TaxID=58331 RepID=A0AAW0JMV4_QUESU